ncbi:MAG: hypothetical protein K0U74_01155 [Alphaproteobacteria bacterium]|nr:hypothetical protein [Alphaproteobacteria bacterium]
MFDVNSQARFNKNCADAMVNYMQASGAAYQAMADQMLQMWGQSVDAMVQSGQQSPRLTQSPNFFQPPSRPTSAASCMMPWAAVPNAAMNANPMASFNPFGQSYGMFSPMNNWMEAMMPAHAKSWPMAFGMISFGVPEQVAWPTARANAAAMDAFSMAADTVEKAMNDYRPEAPRRDRVERVETGGSNPFALAFSVMPYNQDALMRMFALPDGDKSR